ncbi:hypothetical protein BDL97_02G118700 [Sphagnum fallax]|nr:hypothetical protein BDL97_02G118700 [Sphagnum fallax]
MGIARDGCCPEIRKNGRHISKPRSSVVVFLHACLCLSVVVQEALERTPFICQSANVSFFKFLPQL